MAAIARDSIPLEVRPRLRALQSYERKHGRPATIRLIMEMWGLHSTHSASYQLKKLTRQGFLVKEPWSALCYRTSPALPNLSLVPCALPREEWPFADAVVAAWTDPVSRQHIFEFEA